MQSGAHETFWWPGVQLLGPMGVPWEWLTQSWMQLPSPSGLLLLLSQNAHPVLSRGTLPGGLRRMSPHLPSWPTDGPPKPSPHSRATTWPSFPGFPVIRGLSARWMRGPLAGEDRGKHTQGACRWLSCVCALLLPLCLTPSPPLPPPGQDLWGALLLESREPQPGLQKYSSAPEPSGLEADLLGALRDPPPPPAPVSLQAFGRLWLFHKVGSALTRAHR